MSSKGFFKKYPLLYVSPWFSAAAIGLLALIIIIFAANNLQRDKKLATDRLFKKGQDLIRFVGAGTRATMMMGMLGTRSSEQVQQFIEQASDDPEILYIMVLDDTSRILAHSDTALVGKTMERDLPPVTSKNTFQSQIISSPENDGKIFEVISPFRPLKPRHRFMRNQRARHLSFKSRESSPPRPDSSQQSSTSLKDTAVGQKTQEQGDWCRNIMNFNPARQNGKIVITVGLSMEELEKAIKGNRFQIIFMSVTLLLVGLGGWLSLLTAQGYRIAQETLNQVQAFTGLLISRLPVGIIATDQEGKIKTFNQTAATITGKKSADAITKTPSESLPQTIAGFFAPQQEDEQIEKEIIFQSDAGDTFTIHFTSMPISSRDGKAIGRVLLLQDLTFLKEMEKKMRRHEQLAALGKMAAGVAHEVRNPLSSIKGFATLLGSKFSEGSDEDEAARLLVHEVERLNRSITELLDFAKPLPLNLEKVDIGNLVNDTLKLMRADAEELGASITCDVDPTVPEIEIDPDRLKQVLLNLYLNALQAMAENGTLAVVVKRGEDPGTVEISVGDTGCGIPAEITDQILDPYFTTKPEGTGLGLAIVQKIIDEHGGTINITSKEGEGTTVTISLPA